MRGSGYGLEQVNIGAARGSRLWDSKWCGRNMVVPDVGVACFRPLMLCSCSYDMVSSPSQVSLGNLRGEQQASIVKRVGMSRRIWHQRF